MAVIRTNQGPPPTVINNFLGLNEDTAGDTQLKLGESPEMNNFRLTENYKLEKRNGYLSIFDSLGALSIRGMWYGKVGSNYHLLFSAGGHIYKHNTFTGINTIIGSCTDTKANFFSFGQKVYFINGNEYLSWDGTGTFASVTGYIPLVAVATQPSGGGSLNEQVNLLNGNKKQSFSGDGTAVYTLLESNVDSVDSVYVDGVLKTVTTHYTVNLAQGKITFTAGNIPTTGVDNVVIAWKKGNGSRSEVTSYKYAMYYGGQNDTRVFLYGNGTNKYHYTGLANGVPSAEYFPALNYQQVGTDEFAVTDIVRQYDRQIIFTNGKEAYYSYYETVTDQAGNVIPSFPTFPLNDAIGNVAYGQAQIIQNNPFTLQSGVYEWGSTNVRDERNAVFKSKRVQPSLSQEMLENAITIDFEYKKEYWVAVGNRVWVYNYLLDAWYKFTLNDTPTCFLILDEQLFFGTTSGTIMQFIEDELTDDTTPINSHWEMGFYDFGAEWLQKFLNRTWVSMKPGTSRKLDVSWETDAGVSSESTTIKYRLYGYKDVHYGDWSYETQYNPQPFLLKVKAKKFVYFKLILENNYADANVTVLSINLLSRMGGESK